MANAPETLIGTGIYTIAEASRLTRVSPGRIRRWLRGYSFVSSGCERTSPPVWRPQLPVIDKALALGFLDLVEIRFVDAFLDHGVTWKTLRLAAARARDLVGSTHPFCTRSFKTDGRTVFADLYDEGGERALVDLAHNQQVFARILSPYLRNIEFDREEPVRWWPLGDRRRVVIDPARSFGQPIITDGGVPTAVIAQAVQASSSIAEVARWYEVDRRSVRDAIAFEKSLAA